MNGKVIVAGVGPGDPRWLTLRVCELLEKADVVAGFESALAVVDRWITGEKLILDYGNQEHSLAQVAAHARAGKLCLVACYGDPNFSDKEFLARIRQQWPAVEVLPGISSAQAACAKAGIAMEDALFVTLHRREGYIEAFEELAQEAREQRRHVIVLPRPWELMPNQIAKLLLERGTDPAAKVVVYERLTLEGESSLSSTLGRLASSGREFSHLSILIIFRPDQAVAP